MTNARDWQAWHLPYDEPGSPLHRRLRLVQGHIASWLGDPTDRERRVVSLCAGQGRDLIEVLAQSPAAARTVRARLVELDPANASAAQRAAREAGLSGVEVACADAGDLDAYLGAVPADLVLACGVFGNISDEDVHRTIGLLPRLCAADASVIWTRSRRPPDLTPGIRSWFSGSGFTELAFDAPSDALFSVGVHRLVADPLPHLPGQRLFHFVP